MPATHGGRRVAPLVRAALLALVAFLPTVVARTGAAADDAPDALRLVVKGDDVLVRVPRAAIAKAAPGWPADARLAAYRGAALPPRRVGAPSTGDVTFLVRGTRGRATTYEIRPEVADPQGLAPAPPHLVEGDATTPERRTDARDRRFGPLAAADAAVYDVDAPRWFLLGVPPQGNDTVDCPVVRANRGTEPLRVVARAYATHPGAVALRLRWGATDHGVARVDRAVGGADLAWSVPPASVPEAAAALRFEDVTEPLPPPVAHDTSDDRGYTWVDEVTLVGPRLVPDGPRLLPEDAHDAAAAARVPLRRIDVSDGLVAARDAPDPVAAARDAAMVILATTDLLAGARRLAEHRTKTGVRAVVVPAADVLAGWRVPRDVGDAERLRDYVLALSSSGRLRYVLLAGDAVLDRDDLSAKETIPTLYARTMYNGATASDHEIVGDPRAERAETPSIGRLPFGTAAEMDAYVDRVVRWETSPPPDPTRRLLRFVANEGRFGALADRMIESLFRRLVSEIDPAYDAEVTFASVSSPYCWPPREFSQKVVDALSEGALFFTYVGHGWAHGFDEVRTPEGSFPVLGVEDARKVTARGTPPVVAAIACTTARFDWPNDECVGEALLRRPLGPLAYVGATRVCHPAFNAVAGREIALRMFPLGDRRFGDVWRETLARSIHRDPSDAARRQIEFGLRLVVPGGADLDRLNREGVAMYTLLGDPALRLPAPAPDLVVEATPTATGLRVRARGPLPDGTRVVVSVEVPRDVEAHERLPLVKTAADPEGFATCRENHARANDKAVWRGEAVAKGGEAVAEAVVPEARRGTRLHAKAWAVYLGDLHQGAATTAGN